MKLSSILIAALFTVHAGGCVSVKEAESLSVQDFVISASSLQLAENLDGELHLTDRFVFGAKIQTVLPWLLNYHRMLQRNQNQIGCVAPQYTVVVNRSQTRESLRIPLFSRITRRGSERIVDMEEIQIFVDQFERDEPTD